MKGKEAGIEEVIATFSAHVTKTYTSPDVFRDNLTVLLEDKKQRMEEEKYAVSLEKNIVFLHDLIVEGEAFIDVLLGLEGKENLSDETINSMLRTMEEKIRDRMDERYRDIFIDGAEKEFSELFELKKSSSPEYIAKLEFNYRHLMTLRILLFEFFNMLINIKSEYAIRHTGTGESRNIINNINFTANYYLGNVSVAESDGGTKKVH